MAQSEAVGSQIGSRPSSRTLGLLAIAAAATFGCSMLGALDGGVSSVERSVFGALNGVPDALAAPFVAVQVLGGVEFLGLWAIVAGMLRGWHARVVLPIFVAGAIAKALTELSKHVVDRPRPGALWPEGRDSVMDVIRRTHDPGGAGFPSGHAAVAFAVAVVTLPLLPARQRWVPLAVAAIVAIGRVVAGVHLPLDALSGAALGSAVGAAVLAVVSGAQPESDA